MNATKWWWKVSKHWVCDIQPVLKDGPKWRMQPCTESQSHVDVTMTVWQWLSYVLMARTWCDASFSGNVLQSINLPQEAVVKLDSRQWVLRFKRSVQDHVSGQASRGRVHWLIWKTSDQKWLGQCDEDQIRQPASGNQDHLQQRDGEDLESETCWIWTLKISYGVPKLLGAAAKWAVTVAFPAINKRLVLWPRVPSAFLSHETNESSEFPVVLMLTARFCGGSSNLLARWAKRNLPLTRRELDRGAFRAQ